MSAKVSIKECQVTFAYDFTKGKILQYLQLLFVNKSQVLFDTVYAYMYIDDQLRIPTVHALGVILKSTPVSVSSTLKMKIFAQDLQLNILLKTQRSQYMGNKKPARCALTQCTHFMPNHDKPCASQFSLQDCKKRLLAWQMHEPFTFTLLL